MISLSPESLSHKIAQVLAHAVRKMAENEPWVATSAQPHIGKTIGVTIKVLGRGFQLSWRVDSSDILQAVALKDQLPVTVQLIVAPTVYSSIMQLPFDMQRIMRQVHISGDAQLAEWVNRLAQQLRPEIWEDVSKIIGDVPTHYLQRGVHTVFGHFKSALKSLTQQAQYAMLDETPVFVRHEALDSFANEAQTLRYATERLAQRVERLAQGAKG